MCLTESAVCHLIARQTQRRSSNLMSIKSSTQLGRDGQCTKANAVRGILT